MRLSARNQSCRKKQPSRASFTVLGIRMLPAIGDSADDYTGNERSRSGLTDARKTEYSAFPLMSLRGCGSIFGQ